MTLNVGERTLELYYLKNVHSEADTRDLAAEGTDSFYGGIGDVKRFGNHRPFVSIPDTLSAIKMMKALNPEVVMPGHGTPGTTSRFSMTWSSITICSSNGWVKWRKQGKSLDEIKKELRMPETDDWEGKDRFPQQYRGGLSRGEGELNEGRIDHCAGLVHPDTP